MAAHSGHGDFSKHAEELRVKATDLAGDAAEFIGKNAGDYYKKGMQEARKVEKSIEGKIKEKPLQAVLIAAGIGLVLGALWKRRA